jgi:hypothetical protein
MSGSGGQVNEHVVNGCLAGSWQLETAGKRFVVVEVGSANGRVDFVTATAALLSEENAEI